MVPVSGCYGSRGSCLTSFKLIVMKNTPYVKKFGADGKVINPIIGFYKNDFPNRKERRKRTPRFIGNGKNLPLTVYREHKYLRHIQYEIDADGNAKKILHYLPA